MLHKILVLHGYRNNAARLKYQMLNLVKNLTTKGVEFVFLDSDILYTPEAKEEPLSEDELKKFGPYRKWWTTDRTRLLTQRDYDTGTEAVSQVENFIARNPDITCILGFSQGSSLLQMLPSLALPQIKKVILIGGIPVYDTEEKKLHRHADTLHIIGQEDAVVQPEASKNLAKMFPNSKIYLHKGKHYVPTNKEACVTVLNYLNHK